MMMMIKTPLYNYFYKNFWFVTSDNNVLYLYHNNSNFKKSDTYIFFTKYYKVMGFPYISILLLTKILEYEYEMMPCGLVMICGINNGGCGLHQETIQELFDLVPQKFRREPRLNKLIRLSKQPNSSASLLLLYHVISLRVVDRYGVLRATF